MYNPCTCMWVHVHVQVLCIHTAFQHVQANLNICKISIIVVVSGDYLVGAVSHTQTRAEIEKTNIQGIK